MGWTTGSRRIERARIEERQAARRERPSGVTLKEAVAAAALGTWEFVFRGARVVLDAPALRLLGHESDTPRVVRGWMEHVHPADRACLRALWSEGQAPLAAELRLRTHAGGWRWVEVRGAVVDRERTGEPLRAAGVLLDVDQRKVADLALRHQATHDPLTGLANRAHLLALLGERMRDAARHGHALSVCLIDLDGFKAINDTHGHVAGDRVLTAVGAVLRLSLRADDVAGRLGGDELCLVLPRTSGADAVEATERVRRAIASRERDADGQPLPCAVTATFGVAELEAQHTTAEELLEAADRALYAAKRGGKNRTVRMSRAEVRAALRGARRDAPPAG